jgi:hypothetical protein
MTAVSAAGVFIDGLYHDGAWAREAFRGADFVTLVLAAPVSIVALVRSRRGSLPAQAVWVGMLAYSIYNFMYASFGPAFNDVFLLHILLIPLSILALVCALAGLDLASIAERLDAGRAAMVVGVSLIAIGAIQGGLWIFVLIRYVVTGQVLHDIPVAGQHLVFAIDLSLLVPSLLIAGILLLRRSAMGVVWAAAMSVMGLIYLINLLAAGVFQARAGVPGVKAFPAESVVLTIVFLACSATLLRGNREIAKRVRV